MVECLCISRILGHMFGIDPLGFRKISQVEQTPTEIVSGVRVVRLGCDDLSDVRQGFSESPFFQQTHREGITRVHVVRIMRDGEPKVTNRVTRIASLLLKETRHQVCQDMVGDVFQHSLTSLESANSVSLLERRLSLPQGHKYWIVRRLHDPRIALHEPNLSLSALFPVVTKK